MLDTGTEKINVRDPSQGSPTPAAACLRLPAAAQEGSPVPGRRCCHRGKPAQAVAADFQETWIKCFHFQKVKSWVCFHSRCSTKQVAAPQRSHCPEHLKKCDFPEPLSSAGGGRLDSPPRCDLSQREGRRFQTDPSYASGMGKL